MACKLRDKRVLRLVLSPQHLCEVEASGRTGGERVDADAGGIPEQATAAAREPRAVDRPWKRKFLGYSITAERTPRLNVAPESERREELKAEFRRARGRNLGHQMQELRPLLIGWSAYFRYAEVKTTFERLDEWIRRRFRCVQRRQ